ncbi:MAG TPA: hypothetical protein VHF47_07880 [Acidimicrobiales bacterium]|nr:hypothetical protein [Acidimicrobiales bacterium]
MIGALALAFVIVVVLPVTFLVLGGVLSAVMGWLLKDDAEHRFEDSELLRLDG